MMHVVNVDPVVKGLAVIYADTKDEVPETAEAVFEALEPNEYSRKLGAGLAAGTIIMTSAFDVACIRGDGLIQWKGDPVPTPPPASVTVTLHALDGAGYIGVHYAYTDGNGETQTVYLSGGLADHDEEISTISGETILIVPDGMGMGGEIETTASYVGLDSATALLENGGGAYLVLVGNEDFTINVKTAY